MRAAVLAKDVAPRNRRSIVLWLPLVAAVCGYDGVAPRRGYFPIGRSRRDSNVQSRDAAREAQYPDDCFRYAGDLVDGDMKVGDFADAKGEEYSRLLSIPGVGKKVMAQIVDVTLRHLRAAQARGAGLKVYFAERDAADRVRNEFAKNKYLHDVVVAHLPPSKPKPRGRFR